MKSKQKVQQTKQNTGTIKRYLSDTQLQILLILNKHLIQSPSHPIVMICEIFRQEFEKAYNKYTKP